MLSIRNTTLAIVTAAAASLLPQTAEAGHVCYEYTGRCYHFHSEQHLINALRHLEHVYDEHMHGHNCVSSLQRAKVEISYAYRELDCPHARQDLGRALDYVRGFIYSQDCRYLDAAARMVHGALDHEREMFLASQHQGHGHGHGPGFGPGHGQIGQPAYGPVRRGGVTIRFGNGGIRFGF